MSLFNKYKPYLYDMLDEAQRKKIGVEMFTHLTTLTSNPENGGTPNVYLGSFTKSDMGFVAELFSDFVEDSHYDKGGNYNKVILEGVVANSATDVLWLYLNDKYNKLSVDELQTLVKNKELLQDNLYLIDKLKDKLDDFAKKLKQCGINIIETSEKTGIPNFNNLLYVKELLESPIITDEQIVKNGKESYIYEMVAKGFDIIDDSTVIQDNSGLYTNLLNWLQGVYIEKPDKITKYKSKVVQLNDRTLKEEGIHDTKSLSLWDMNEIGKDEDLKFRIFVRENDFSLDISIKVPKNTPKYVFDFSDNMVNNSVASLFNNSTYNCNLLENPAIKSLRSTRSVDTAYDAVNFAVVKDFMEFKNSSWKLMDYLKAAKGIEQNAFSKFEKLPLGEEIAVGVKPNALKVDRFDYSGKYFNSGMIMGGAGSGKSALIHSLVVQFLALQGADGNGSVILLDAKQELPNAWRGVLKERGIPFYSWDGAIIKDLKSAKYKNKKGEICSFSTPITQYQAGMMFLNALQNVINGLLGKADKEHIKDFNKGNVDIDGITRLPRIAIIIDEWNVLYRAVKSASSKGGDTPFLQTLADTMTGFPQKTRTQGLMWWYSGQDLAKSYIGSDKLSSITYRLIGAMGADRYEYFNVVENETIKEYEAKTFTGSGARPIMSQGSFYAGGAGQTEFTRSLFVGNEKERGDCLDVLDSAFEGMFELDKIVKYALKNHLFDADCTFAGVTNNLVYVALHDIGMIDDIEFYEATERIFGNASKGAATSGDLDMDKIRKLQEERRAKLTQLEGQGDLSDEQKRQKEHLEEQIEKTDGALNREEEKLRQQLLAEKESALKEINALKSKYGEKISKAGKSLYSYKKDEVLFNDAKQSILDTREGYMTGFMEVIEKVNDSVLQGELISVATLFLDERFKSIEDMTFEGIQGGRAGDDREGGGGTSTENPIGYTGTSNNPPAPVRQDNPRQVNTFTGQKVGGTISTNGQTFDLDEYEDGGGFGRGSKNLKLLEDITTLVIRDVRRQFGGAQGISEISINAGGGLVIDGFAYSPEFEPELVESMPATKQQYYKAGNLAKIINIGAVVDSIIPYAMSLSIETPAVAEDVTFQRELGIKKKNNYAALFKSCHNLQIIRLPNEELTRDNPNSSMEGNSGGGLGAKLAGLFGFGKGRKDSANYVPNTASSDNSDSLSNRIFDSKPVRVMTSALGWTLGVKAVVMAATIFGPWGLLFGAFAAAGAYKEIKKDNQNKTDARRESRGSSSTKSSKDKNSGGFSGTYDKKK